jgi:ADP-ribose pyrophosphatase YjhB (NUDIX family)/predicted transcriptional regulator
MEDLHQIQLEILRKLLFNPNATFTKLIHGETNTMLHSYHLKTLLKMDLIEKTDGKYRLTSKGKEFANRIDTEETTAKIEKQPKIGVCVHVWKGSDYTSKFIVQTRLKEPFFGYKGGITGKVKFGETSFETAERETAEETGLTGDFYFHGMVHFINYHDEKLVEDKYFMVFSVLNAKGDLMVEGEGFKNEWMTLEEFEAQSPIYDGERELIKMCTGEIKEGFMEVKNVLREF